MKKTFSFILILTVILTVVSSCAGGSKTDPFGFKTIGDIISTPGVEEYRMSTVGNDKFVYVYKLDGTFYRAITSITEEQSDAIWDIDISAEDFKTKREELMSSLVIEKIEDLSGKVLSKEEIDRWIGKTGKEMFDAGWTSFGWNLDEMVFWMNYDVFQYDVVMEGEIKDRDNFGDEDINTLVVKSISPNGQIGDASNID